MKPLYTGTLVVTTITEFFPIDLHPTALRFEQKCDGQPTFRGVVPRKAIEALDNPSDYFLASKGEHEEQSLSANAVWWPVKKDLLLTAEGPGLDLFDHFDKWELKHLNDPDYTLVCKSGWDHRIWGIDGEQILMPTCVELWGTHYDLSAVEAHLKDHPNVVSFEIERNRCYQNHAISGTHLGQLVIDPKGLDLPKDAEIGPSWFRNYFLYGSVQNETDFDLLGLRQFKLTELLDQD